MRHRVATVTFDMIRPPTRKERFQSAVHETLKLFRQVLPRLFVGVGIGALIFGFVPEAFVIGVAGAESVCDNRCGVGRGS